MGLVEYWDSVVPQGISDHRRRAIIDFLQTSGLSIEGYEHTAIRQMIANADWAVLAREIRRYIHKRGNPNMELLTLRHAQAYMVEHG